ncbi:SDR family NAD(P)-dependent oxidoreductase [Streptosporangium lutulentum]
MRKRVVVVIGVGGMGEVVARRQGTGHLVLLADFNEATLDKVGESMRDDGYDVVTHQVDVTSRESMRALARAADAAGQVVQVVHTAPPRDSGTGGSHHGGRPVRRRDHA